MNLQPPNPDGPASVPWTARPQGERSSASLFSFVKLRIGNVRHTAYSPRLSQNYVYARRLRGTAYDNFGTNAGAFVATRLSHSRLPERRLRYVRNHAAR